LLRVGVDVGGTFTDVVLWDDAAARATVFKLPSTPDDPSRAAREGIEEAVRSAGRSLADLDQVFHGTTVATNIALQHSGARVGFITTEGFRDVLHAARHKKPHAFSLFQDLPWQSHPLVRRRDRRVVAERIVPPDGDVLIALDEDAVRRAAVELRDSGVDAIAIGFLFSFLDSTHERRAKEICQEVAPDLYVCTSSEVLPQFREYERFSTTALDAYVGPAVRAYIEALASSLLTAGVTTELHLMNSAGGVVTAAGAAARPSSLLMSGPVAGVLGGVWAGRLSGFESVITLDVGGTSADIGVAPGGELRMKHILDSEVAGYHTMMPTADCDSIGAGGGSIAFVDDGGVLRVGPRSAGAEPGPACYGRGGLEPTVTDAELVLGRLGAAGLLGGRLPLDRERAVEAIRARVAEPLGLTVEEAAMGVVEIVTENMASAIETNSVRKGLDPRDFSLVAIGGAGPLFGCDIAARLGLSRVIVPPHPGLTAALGLLTSGLVYELGTTVLRGTEENTAAVAAAYADLERETGARLAQDGIPEVDRKLQRLADCRYEGQGYELRIECPDGAVDGAWREEVVRRFHAEHARLYYRSAEDRPVQIVNARIRGVARVADVEWPALDRAEPAERTETRRAWFRVEGRLAELETPVYERDALGRGQRLEGPAIVGQFESTTVLPPGYTLEVDPHGNLLVEVSAARVVVYVPAGGEESVDPITFRVIGGAFDAIAEEMAAVQIRMSYSGIIRESEDMGAGIFDHTGREICESHTSPMHIGSIPWYIRGVISTWGEDFTEGDVILHNHPYKGASHSPDAAIIMPIFHGGRLVAFSGVTGHMLDLGGAAPGLNMDVVDVWAENKLYDGLKIYEAGELNTELWRHILGNTRVPVENRGDFEAMIAACRVGKERFLALLDRYGADIVFQAAEEWMDYSERMLRREIEKIPDGTYRAPTGWLDDNGRDRGKPLRLECAVHVKGSDIVVDLTGSEAESPTSYNSPFEGGTQVAAYYIVRTILLDDATFPVHVPQNEGIFRPVKVVAPLGTIYNPSFPRACSGRFMKCERICDNVILALSEPLPEQTTAGNGAVCHAIAYSGYAAERGQYWVYIEINESSYGGRFGKDGLDSVDSLLVNTRNNPIEELELRYPLRIHRYELRPEPPAPGRWRGGIGIVRETQFLADGFVSSEADRHYDPPRGVYGGHLGLTASMARRQDGVAVESLPALLTGVEFPTDDALLILTPSSGGYGDPLERRPEAVADDVLDGYLTAELALEQYGVVLTAAGELDPEATAQERAARSS
jgi:5-oxoprolinase (ATP-hydrolysing)